MIQYMIVVSIGKAAARIVNINNTEIICGRFENLQVSTKFKHRSTHCDVTLRYYGLSAPEGSLAQSVCSEQKMNDLAASFVHTPAGEHVDWSLSATISPCHATLKIEKVTRRAQEQFQMVLEEQSRFALDIDLDAPKVRVPIRSCTSLETDGHLLLDFGHFTLKTKEDGQHDQLQSLYSRFYISGRDIAAFFTSSDSESQSDSGIQQVPSSSGSEDVDNFYSLIDRCGMAVVVDQVSFTGNYNEYFGFSTDVNATDVVH